MKPKKQTNASRIVYERIYHFLRFRDHMRNKENASKSWRKWADKYSREALTVWSEYDQKAASRAVCSYMLRSSVSQQKETIS